MNECVSNEYLAEQKFRIPRTCIMCSYGVRNIQSVLEPTQIPSSEDPEVGFLSERKHPKKEKDAQDYFHVQNKTKISTSLSYSRVYQTVVSPNKGRKEERLRQGKGLENAYAMKCDVTGSCSHRLFNW
jgi:hypothetical protein